MEEKIETTVSPEKVWASWEKAHEKKSGAHQKFRYEIIDLVPGRRFSILWKTLFIRLLFTHAVTPTKWGSEIRFNVVIKGPFAWPVRWFLGKKIQQNISLVLKSIVKQLEEESVIETRNRRRS